MVEVVMEKIIVASKNPVKINAALVGFQRMFPDTEFEAVGMETASGVADQPMTGEETLEGARNRVANLRKSAPEADYFVGIEAGVYEDETGMQTLSWAVIEDKSGHFGKGRAGTLTLPPKVSELIKQGKELGEADDIVFGQKNSKQAGGAVGLLTGNVIERQATFEEAVIFALIPFKNPDLYFSKNV